MKGITTRPPAERSGTLPGGSGTDGLNRPVLSPSDWKRLGLSGHVQSVSRDTEMILKICVNRIKWLK